MDKQIHMDKQANGHTDEQTNRLTEKPEKNTNKHTDFSYLVNKVSIDLLGSAGLWTVGFSHNNMSIDLPGSAGVWTVCRHTEKCP